MTNTHITIGGHKVTTNKVGQVHELTPEGGVTISKFRYCITNGICFVSVWGIRAEGHTGASLTISSNIPKPKFETMDYVYNEPNGKIIADMWVHASGNNGILGILFNTNTFGYGSISYPVADDWVES